MFLKAIKTFHRFAGLDVYVFISGRVSAVSEETDKEKTRLNPSTDHTTVLGVSAFHACL